MTVSRGRPGGVSTARWIAAGAGVVFSGAAIAGALGGSAWLGACLSGEPSALAALGHCPWCWAAAGAFLLAAAPVPRVRRA